MSPSFLGLAIRTGVLCATAHAVNEIHHDAKKAEKRAKKAEKEAKKRNSATQNINNHPQTVGAVKPIMFHVNMLSNRIPLIQSGCPNFTALSIYYDQTLGGWRAAPRGTRPNSCDNRGAPHTFVTLPHYVAFAFMDMNGQTVMLFSDKSCSVCGEHAILTSQQIPYQQIVSMSRPNILNEVGVPTPTGPVPQMPMGPSTQPMPGQPLPPPMPQPQPQPQFTPGMSPPSEPSRDVNPIYDVPPAQPGCFVPPPM